MKYVVELSPEQVAVLRRACEILARLHMSQFDMVFDEAMLREPAYSRNKEHYGSEVYNMWNEVRDRLDEIKVLLTPDIPRGAYYGIHSSEISDVARVAYDIQQVLRHCQSWEEHPLEKGEFQTVSYDTPYRTSTKQQLAKIRVEKDKD